MDDIKQEFWGDLQADLYVQNTAVYLANQSLSQLISETGYKAHRPILSHPQVGTYTPYSDISFTQKSATKETLEVDTFEYAAEEIDVTEVKQSPYNILGQSLMSIRKGLMNGVEQKFLSEITNAEHDINSGTALAVTTANILDILEEAEGKLGAFDAPYETAMRACVLGPRTVARLRRAKSDRESRLGDSVLANGVVGPWQGWTVVQSNNLPWSATLELATEPTNGDTVTIGGVTFEFQDNLDNVTSGYVGVLCGTNVDTTRAALVACINDSGTAGTDYVQMGAKHNFIIRRKRRITATNDNDNDEMTLAGFGDIAVSDDLTDATDCWADQQQESVFMIRGAVDMVLQFMDLKVADKEAGFADLPKGIIGVGTKTFADGALLMVNLTQDVSDF